MKYHVIGEPFKLNYTASNGEKAAFRVVAVESETTTYMGEVLRAKNDCSHCAFGRRSNGWVSGHPDWSWHCACGTAEKAKCVPEAREDGKFIYYKIEAKLVAKK